ncbi:Cof-type HAD-IIB family hydrolase [Collinsella vaginalis]|uniref:Cof-type HAD-IIB family hydrolase n=1 Tax=Collinsella vaginalis TaxID=1870987 RepID=UPI000A26D0EA|nr:Cof-type HAD-IIB family hydrolase [Collinsella vaginalis]
MLPSFETDTDLASVKLIACDMDLTLLADDGSMPPHMAERIRALDAAGITFCAASGRPSYTLCDMFPEVHHLMGLIADNGGAIFDKDVLIDKSLIDVDAYRELVGFTARDGRGCSCVCGIDTCYLSRKDERFEPYFKIFYTSRIYVDDLTAVSADVNKYTVYFPDNNSEEVFAEAYGPTWSDRFSVTNAGKQWIDFMNKGVNKGSGLRGLCAHLGINPADAIAIGDTYNDIQMLEAAGHGYVVANAEEHMHAHGTHLVPSNNDRGVAQVIDAVLAAVASSR